MDISKLNTRDLRPGELIDPNRRYVTKDGKYVTTKITANDEDRYCWNVTFNNGSSNDYTKEGYILRIDTEHRHTLTKVVCKKQRMIVPLKKGEEINVNGKYIARDGIKVAGLAKNYHPTYSYRALYEDNSFCSLTKEGNEFSGGSPGNRDLVSKVVKGVAVEEKKPISVSKYINVRNDGTTETCASLSVAKVRGDSNLFARKKIEFTVTEGEGL